MIEIIASAVTFLTPAQITRVTGCDRFLSIRVTEAESKKYFDCVKKIGSDLDINLIPTVSRCRKNLAAPFWNATSPDKKAFRYCLKGL